ncbi:MAG: hypothetical protein U0359_06450 [Byssovorax sp.]
MSATRSLVCRGLGALALLGLAASPGCIKRGYPLGRSGAVEVRPDIVSALFAADTLDDQGKPVGARQDPHETGVTLFMTEAGQAAYGAFVDVRVEPAEAMVLLSDPLPDESEPTCTVTDGAFRCRATEQGLARFKVSSESNWSGEANVIVSWADQTQKLPITILPAGLPAEATNFQMIVGGLDDVDHVLATYDTLQCSIGPVPDNLGSKWREGKIRARLANVRATPPPGLPGAVANAPVVIESLNTEAALALSDDCKDRLGRIRVLLDSNGQSPPFYLCFSDVGGTIEFGVSSGQKVIDPNKQVIVDPEPRLLRVRALTSQLLVGSPFNLFEISAYNTDRVRISMPVDVKVDDDQVLAIDVASITLAGDLSDPTVIQALPLKAGKTRLHAYPRLLSMPDCVSEDVSVVEPPF